MEKDSSQDVVLIRLLGGSSDRESLINADSSLTDCSETTPTN